MIAITEPLFAAAESSSSSMEGFVNALFLISVALFVLSLKWLSAPTTARRGVFAGEIGMVLAVCGALVVAFEVNGVHLTPVVWLIITAAVGTALGIPIGVLMPMTAVPQRTAMSHAFGGMAAMLVGVGHYYLHYHPSIPNVPWAGRDIHWLTMAFLCFEVLLGGLTFTGSWMAFGKLQELLPTRPITYPHQNVINLSLLGFTILLGVVLVIFPGLQWVFPIFAILAMVFGVLLILPIGGADMPTVISLLNSYAGLSASMMGFVLGSNLLIVAGCWMGRQV